MKKLLLLTAAIAVVLGFSVSNAEAGTRFSFSVSSGHGYHHGPSHGYYAPAPVYYAPAPVYYAPVRVYHQPRRVYHQPRPVYNHCYQPRRVHRGYAVSTGYYR